MYPHQTCGRMRPQRSLKKYVSDIGINHQLNITKLLPVWGLRSISPEMTFSSEEIWLRSLIVILLLIGEGDGDLVSPDIECFLVIGVEVTW